MKYRKEERLDIARRVYDREMTVSEAAIKYDISPDTVKGLRLYRTQTGLPPMNRGGGASLLRNAATLGDSSLKKYEGMTREELIDELVMARINEARLKIGELPMNSLRGAVKNRAVFLGRKALDISKKLGGKAGANPYLEV